MKERYVNNKKSAAFLLAAILICTSVMMAINISIVYGKKVQKTDSEKILNVFNWSEYLPQTVIDEFQKKYGIKVNYSTYSSNEEMLAKIMAGGSKYDLAVGSDYMIEVLRKLKLAEPINLKNIPNFKNIGAQFKNLSFDPHNQYTVPYMWGDACIAINTKKIKTPVTGVADLWKSDFKNSLVVLDDERAVIGLALKKLGYSLNDTNKSHLDKAKKELLKLKPNIKTYDSDSPKTSLINGEAAAGYVWGAEAALAEKDNKDIKVVLPKEGMYLWQDNFYLPKGVKHKNNAELFINFILDAKVSGEISKVFPYANPNVAAHKYIAPKTLSNIAVYPPQSDVKKGEHLKDLGNSLKDYDAIWTELKSN